MHRIVGSERVAAARLYIVAVETERCGKKLATQVDEELVDAFMAWAEDAEAFAATASALGASTWCKDVALAVRASVESYRAGRVDRSALLEQIEESRALFATYRGA